MAQNDNYRPGGSISNWTPPVFTPPYTSPDTCQCERCPRCGKVKPPTISPYQPTWQPNTIYSGQVYTPKLGEPGTYTING